jgi:hypothetical protein
MHILVYSLACALNRHCTCADPVPYCEHTNGCVCAHTETLFNMTDFNAHLSLNRSCVNNTQVFAPSKGAQLPAPSAINEDLVLEYVYGYRGHDSRANLAYLESGEAVYAAMGMAVVADFGAQTPKQRFFRLHSGGVSCVAVHPDGVHVAR